MALIFLSGNLQSHAYIFLFAAAFGVGYGGWNWKRWFYYVMRATPALLVALALASPFLMSQVELLSLSTRSVKSPLLPATWLSGVASLSGIFPWMLGTFRTLDLSKLMGQSALGFWAYIGSASLLLSILGMISRIDGENSRSAIKRTAIALVAVYMLVCSTPLLQLFYTRCAALAALGLVVLLCFGWEVLARGEHAALKAPARWGAGILALTLLIGAAVNVGAGFIYP